MNQNLIGKIISPEELLVEYQDGEFYRLTNKEECHNEFQYGTGINTDILPFNPKGECKSGGMYFYHISQLHMYKRYCYDIEFIRKVSFTKNSKIYVERDKFKTNEFVLGEREKFDVEKYITEWINKSEERCKIAVQKDGYALRYVEIQTDEICRLAVQQNGCDLQHVEIQTDDICKLAVQQNGFALEYVKIQTDEICRLAVQQNGMALKFVKNQTEEICRLAVQKNGFDIKYVENQTDEL